MKKRILSIIIIISIFISITADIYAQNNSLTFHDVKKPDWFYNWVSNLSSTGITVGHPDGTYKPYNTIDIAEFITFAVKALGYRLENGKNFWADNYIIKAKDLKLIDEGEYNDYKTPISREQMAKIIVRAINGKYNSSMDKYITEIKDFDKASSVYKEYILIAYSTGIMVGSEKLIKPTDNANRAEAAVLIVKLYDFFIKSDNNDQTKQPDIPNNVGYAELSDNINVFDNNLSQKFYNEIESMDLDDTGCLIIKGESDVTNDLKPGTLFLIRPTKEHPEGYMGKVVSNERNNDNSILKVEQPTMEEAFSYINIETESAISTSNISSTNLSKNVSLINDKNANNSRTANHVLLGAGPGFDFSEILKSLKLNIEVDSRKIFEGKSPIYKDISLSVNDAVIYDDDGKEETTNDQIKFGAKIALQNTSLDTAIKFNMFGEKRLKARLISNPLIESKITYSLAEKNLGLDNIIKAKENKAELGALTIEGIKKDKKKIVLGSITFDLGTFTVTPKTGEPIISTLAASVLFTMGLGGKVTAEVTYASKYECFLDKGFDVSLRNGKFNTTLYDVFADASYPNPNVSSKVPTEEQKKSKPQNEYILEGTCKLDATSTIGVDVAVSVLGIVPSKLSNDFGLYSNLELKGKSDNKGITGTISGSMELALKGELFARMLVKDVNDWIHVEGSYSNKVYDVKFWEKNFNISTQNNINDELLYPYFLKYEKLPEHWERLDHGAMEVNTYYGYKDDGSTDDYLADIGVEPAVNTKYTESGILDCLTRYYKDENIKNIDVGIPESNTSENLFGYGYTVQTSEKLYCGYVFKTVDEDGLVAIWLLQASFNYNKLKDDTVLALVDEFSKMAHSCKVKKG